MAESLPLELFNDIVLLNDDDVDYRHGWIANGVSSVKSDSFHESTGPDPISCYSFHREAKSCAKSMARVCPRWYSYVDGSPRLWISHIDMDSDFLRFGRGKSFDLSDFTHMGDIFARTRNSDVNIRIHCYHLDDKWVSTIEKFLNSLLPTSSQWRSLVVTASSKSFGTMWKRFQERMPPLPRLLYVKVELERGLNLRAGLRFQSPRVRYACIENPTYNKTVAYLTPLLPALEALKLREVVDHGEFGNWLTQLATALPSLTFLSIWVDRKMSWKDDWPKNIIPANSHALQPRRHPLLDLELVGAWSFILASMTSLPLRDLTKLRIWVGFRQYGTCKFPPGRFPTMAITHLHLCLGAPEVRQLLLAMEHSTLQLLEAKLSDRPSWGAGLWEPSTLFPRSTLDLRLSMPHLKVLDLENGESLGGPTKVFIAPALGDLDGPNLEELVLRGLTPLTEGYIWSDFKEKCPFPKLKKVTIKGDVETAATISGLHIPALHTIDISSCSSSFDCSPWAAHLPHVRDLQVLVPASDKSFKSFMEPKPSLETLRLAMNGRSNVEILLYLGSCDEFSTSFPRLSKLEVTLRRDVSFGVPGVGSKKQVSILEAIVQMLQARNWLADKLEHLSLVNFRLKKRKRMEYSKISEGVGVSIYWSESPWSESED